MNDEEKEHQHCARVLRNVARCIERSPDFHLSTSRIKRSADLLESQAAEIEALKAERDDLSERLSDFIDDFRMVIGEECPPDQRHCTCVPHLRKLQRIQAERITELEAHIEESMPRYLCDEREVDPQ